MKVLVVYYSRTGVTRTLASSIATELGADLEEVIDRKPRGGTMGFVVAGKEAMLKRLTEISEAKKDPGAYDVVVIGTPVWAWTMSSAIRAYLTREKGRLPAVAFFATMGGTGDERTFRQMEAVCGKGPAATLALREKEVRAEKYAGWVKDFAERLREPEAE